MLPDESRLRLTLADSPQSPTASREFVTRRAVLAQAALIDGVAGTSERSP